MQLEMNLKVVRDAGPAFQGNPSHEVLSIKVSRVNAGMRDRCTRASTSKETWGQTTV
jgi:hypothetical protein